MRSDQVSLQKDGHLTFPHAGISISPRHVSISDRQRQFHRNWIKIIVSMELRLYNYDKLIHHHHPPDLVQVTQ